MKYLRMFLPISIILLLTPSCYYLNQGAVLISHRASSRGFDAALQRSAREHGEDSAEYRRLEEFLALTAEISRYGREELGLNRDRNYSTYLEVENEYLVAVVNAAPPDSLEPYLWRYPFFGPAPYRGFYDPDDARDEALRLRNQGYDTWIRRVDGFSTLGITRDPLISFMMDYSEYSLAQLIFHEQIHATLWVKRAVNFNEELATALGQMAALEYLADRYGENSEVLIESRARISDANQFASDINALATQLNRVYGEYTAVFPELPPDEDLLKTKQSLIGDFQDSFAENYEDRYGSEAYRGFAELEINNAFISLYQTYSGRGEDYRRLYNLAGSVSETIRLLKMALDDPQAYGSSYSRGDDPYQLVLDLISWLQNRRAS
jgi:predicted aminopeptidase